MLFMVKSSTKRHTSSEDVCLSLVFYTGRISNQFMKLHVVYQIISLNTREDYLLHMNTCILPAGNLITSTACTTANHIHLIF